MAPLRLIEPALLQTACWPSPECRVCGEVRIRDTLRDGVGVGDRALAVSGQQLFVGRSQEFALLDSALTDARAGSPYLVWIEGPAGIGKTALVRHFVGRTGDTAIGWAAASQDEEGAPWELPRSLAESVASRATACMPGTQASLHAVAILEGPVPLEVAASLAGLGDPLDALEEAISAGLLVELVGCADTVEPDISIGCVIDCLGYRVDETCFEICLECLDPIGCAACVACAGLASPFASFNAGSRAGCC